MPSAQGPSRGHSSAPGSKPDRDQRAAVHRRPEVQPQRQAEQYRRRRVDPNSSRASHSAIRDANPSLDDPTMPPLVLASTWSSRTRRSRPRKARPAHGKRYFAWSFLLPGPAARRMHAAIRSDVAWATGAPGQRGTQTDTGEHGRPLVKRESHRHLLHVRGVMHPSFLWANDAQRGNARDDAAGERGQGGARRSFVKRSVNRETPE
jgi:hypothetical protein